MVHLCTRCQYQNLKMWAGSLDDATPQHLDAELWDAARHSLIPMHPRVRVQIAELKANGWNSPGGLV